MDKNKQQIGLAITTQSPVLLAAGPVAHNLTETLDFISGNTLRGLLAYHYLEQVGKGIDSVFRRLFLSGEACFGVARIDGALPIPLSARSCKYEGGFAKDLGHGVMDLLLNSGNQVLCCPRCKRSIDYFEGFMDHRETCRQKVKKRLITRTAIDPQRGTASMSRLYSQRVIEEGQTFLGAIELPSDLVPVLRKLLEKEFTAGIGTGVSRGQGWVTVALVPPPELSLGGAAKRYQDFLQRQGQPVLAVTLLSDGLFTDDYLRDRTAPTPRHLEPLGIDPEEWEDQPVRAYAATRLLFGFDGVPLQLPRVPRLAVRAGSAFLFAAQKGCTSPHIPDGLGIDWIGDNAREGYGQAVLWHPFHLRPEEPYG